MKLASLFLSVLFFGAMSSASFSLEPQIIQQAEKTYVGLGINHVPGDNLPPQLWNKFSARVNEIENVSGPAVGLAGDFKADGTATYAAAREVSKVVSIPEGMTVFTTPAGTYADFTLTGPISGMWKALDYIHGDWMPKNGYVSNGAGIEVYPETSDVDAPDFQMHLLVFLKK